MKVVYKLPQFFALALCGLVIVDIHKSIKLATAIDFFEMIKYGSPLEKTVSTVLGMSPYNCLLLTGVILCIIVGLMRRRLLEVNVSKAIMIILLFLIQAFVGVKVYYGIEQIVAKGSFEYFTMGGQSLYGAVFTSLVFVPILAKLFKVNVKKLFDYLSPLCLIVLTFVKLGCYTAGCCGAETCCVEGIDIVLPIQLFEAIWLLIILQIIFNNEQKHINVAKDGTSFFILLILYGVFRFFIEFMWKTPELFWEITINHICAMVSIIIAVFILKKWNKD